MTIIDDLKIYIEQYDRVIWIENDCDIADKLMEYWSMIQSPFNEKECIILYAGKKSFINNNICECREISDKEKEELQQLYYLFDFSDKFFVISERETHGHLSNYLDTGLLSMEEILSKF